MIDLDLIKKLGGYIHGIIDPLHIIDVNNRYQEICPGDLFIVIKGKNRDGIDFVQNAIDRGAVAILTHTFVPNLSVPQIVVEDTIFFVINYVKNKRKTIRAKFIGITGSVGKTTLRNTVFNLLPGKKMATRKSFNIKFSICMSIFLIDNSYDYIITEIGTNFPGEIEDICRIIKPDYVLINRVGIEHSEFFLTIKNILLEEYSIIKYCKYALSSRHNEKLLQENKLMYILEDINHEFLPEIHEPSFLDIGIHKIKLSNGEYFEFNKINNIGVLNAVIFVIKFYDLFNLDLTKLERQINNLNPVCHRGNIIEVNNIIIYDYSYNSNPLSSEVLINSIKEKCTFIAGKMLELDDIENENQKMIGLLYNNQFIENIYIVSDINIPEKYQDKIQIFNENFVKDLEGKIYFQGSNACNLKDIIFKLINYKIN